MKPFDRHIFPYICNPDLLRVRPDDNFEKIVACDDIFLVGAPQINQQFRELADGFQPATFSTGAVFGR